MFIILEKPLKVMRNYCLGPAQTNPNPFPSLSKFIIVFQSLPEKLGR